MTAKKKSNKVKLSTLALKYEKIWHKQFYTLSRWEQEAIIEEPYGRHASELARMVAEEAEKSG
jgi:hypothetical protein